MRILFANDGIGDAGGVQSYLAAVMPALEARGHEVAFLHLDAPRPEEPSPAPEGAPHFCIATDGLDAALDGAWAWEPDVIFSHNMRPLEVEQWLLEVRPVVKMMHGYFGTCIGGQKTHLFPRPKACRRVFGPACLALYVPRRNGRLSPGYIAREWRWANEQRALFGAYAGIVTASEHMRHEFIRNGVAYEKAHAIPLFSTLPVDPAPAPASFSALFLGRMTTLKGGDLLIRAAAYAAAVRGAPIPLVMAGDGPRLEAWARLAASLGVDAEFTGWVGGEQRLALLRAASVLVVPSVWPEPFGLVGLEAASQGVPSFAFDVGGIDEWLTGGVNGQLLGYPRVDVLGEALAWAAMNPEELAAMRPHAADAARTLSLDAHVAKLEQVLSDAARAPVVGA